MGNLIELLKNEAERTPEEQKALYMHEQLILHRQMVEVGLASMCRDLKEIRDGKLYLQLGYDEFGAYTEAEHGIKQRQAYKYIQVYEKLGIEILHSSAKLGVTKLLEIAALDKDEREELMAAHSVDELADMSTEEVKQLTAQVKKLEEQISFLQEEKRQRESEPAQVEQRPFAELEADIRAEIERDLNEKHAAEIAELESQLAAVEEKSISDEELEKYRANAEKEAKAVAAEETKKLRAELKAAKDESKQQADAIKKAEDARKAAEEKAQKAEEQAKRAAELEAQIAAAQAEKDAAEKKIKLSADPEYTRFKFMFEQWQHNMSALIEQISKLDADKQEKVKQAIRKVWEVSGL